MPRRIMPEQRKAYIAARAEGYMVMDAIRRPGVGISRSTALTIDKQEKLKAQNQLVNPTELSADMRLPHPIAQHKLSPRARKAFDDFGYFQEQYLGRIPQNWQAEAAETIVDLLETPYEEYAVINVGPGFGKTTVFTHDIPCWLTIRNRAIRGLLGSVTANLASRNVNRLRRTLERPVLISPPIDLIKKGIAVEPKGVIARDFGRFRPLERDLWTREQFIVLQDDNSSITEKEPTWSSYGMDTSYIGSRMDFIMWDDLVDPRKMRNPDSREQLEQDWDAVAETRLEPGGLLVLMGQRLFADDLYRYNLDKKSGDDEENLDYDSGGPKTGERSGMKYHHIVFKAHYEDKCHEGSHDRHAPSYPEGCLLSNWRMPYAKVKTTMAQANSNWDVVYQQMDTTEADTLVSKSWIYGDNTHFGCLDETRDICEVPKGLHDLFSVATVDPSGSQFWGIEHWLWHPDSEQRFLFNIENKKMEANDLLDFNYNSGEFYGVMDEWQKISNKAGVPIRYWVVEINAAQRYLLQTDVVRRWCALHNTQVVPHSTGRNKADPDLGVWSISSHYEYGRVRLPYKPNSIGKIMSIRLINELTRYPGGRTSDLVMAHWFFEWQLPRLWTPPRPPVPQKRPSWMKEMVSV